MFFQNSSLPLYTPAEENTNFILRITEGCAYNKCTFCRMYKGVPFRELPLQEIVAQLVPAKAIAKKINSVFLVDANCFDVPFEKLKTILKIINTNLPSIERISAYATIRSLVNLTKEQVTEVYNAKLKRLYIGIESGDDTLLKAINKGNTTEETINVCRTLKEIGIEIYINIIDNLPGETETSRNNTEKLLQKIKTERIERLSYYK